MGTCALLTASHVTQVFQMGIQEPASQVYLLISDVAQLTIPFAFLGVVLRLRMTRAAVGELVLTLGSELSLDGLRDAVARALGDPSVEMGLWDECPGAFRDAAVWRPVNKKPVEATAAETARNPRARSAKLRVALRSG